MKYVVRPEIWESNSSMSHSCIILPKRLAKEWEENDDMYHYHGEILTYDELKKKLARNQRYLVDDAADEDVKEDMWQDFINKLRWENVCTYQNWISDFGDYYDDEDTTEYTTESGDEIVIYCKYGAHY